MGRQDQFNATQMPVPFQRATASWIHTCIAIQSETVADQQTITGTATGGTGTITANGQTTSALQFNASASQIQVALNALSTIAAGGVECTGGPLGTAPVVVNFIGSPVQGPQPVMTLGTGSLTGGTWTIAHTTTGSWVALHTKRALKASSILNAGAPATPQMIMAVFDNVTVQADFPAPGYQIRNGVITNATNANPIVITSNGHGITNGNTVTITGVGGNTAANVSTVVATVLTANTFSIPVTGNGAYTSGGSWVLSDAQVDGDMDFSASSVFNAFL